MNMESAKSANISESELDLPIWSVISFERSEASGLTYSEAVEKEKELERERVAGLCIVTYEAAGRVKAR
jgi:hypothetical protein